jgi:hypothetical protein
MARSAIGLICALACASLLAAGCSSSEEDETPSACLTGSADYIAALKAAPADVRLSDATPISDCLIPEQDGGELAQVGSEMIAAATLLNAPAQREPAGAEAAQLGYLVGAVERGADPIHADLVLRLNSAARFSERGLLPPEFERTFGQGYAAGKETG